MSSSEVVWAGLALDAKSMTDAAFIGLTIVREDAYGSRTITYYDVNGTDVVVISADSSKVGVGILCEDETEAKRKVDEAKQVLSDLNIPGTVSVWKMYNPPKAA